MVLLEKKARKRVRGRGEKRNREKERERGGGGVIGRMQDIPCIRRRAGRQASNGKRVTYALRALA